MATKLSKNMLIQTGDKSQTLKVQSQTKSHNPIPSKNKKTQYFAQGVKSEVLCRGQMEQSPPLFN